MSGSNIWHDWISFACNSWKNCEKHEIYTLAVDLFNRWISLQKSNYALAKLKIAIACFWIAWKAVSIFTPPSLDDLHDLCKAHVKDKNSIITAENMVLRDLKWRIFLNRITYDPNWESEVY